MKRIQEALPVRVLVAGEALIDLVRADDVSTYRATPGGSPFNIAIGLARLDVPTGFVGKVSTDAFGRQLRRTLCANGVATDYVREDTGPTTLAIVTRRPGGEPQFTFYGAHAADQQLHPEDLPSPLPPSVLAIHVGSYAMARQPIGSTLTKWIRREHDRCLISFDPNVRPRVIPDPEAYRRQIPQWVASSHIVKLSLADLEFLAPDVAPEEIARAWLGTGPKLVVITAGKDGAVGFTPERTVHMASPDVDVVDSVGAGDAFMSGLLAWLFHHDRLSIDKIDRWEERDLADALSFASTAASITCTRPGADPPRSEDLHP